MVEQFFNASQFRPGLNNFVLFRVWRALSAGQDFVRPFFAQYCSATVDHIPSVSCNGTSRITNDTSEGVTKPKVSNASNFEDEKNLCCQCRNTSGLASSSTFFSYIWLILVDIADKRFRLLLQQVVCLSVRLSARNVEVSWSRKLEFFENNFTIS